MAKEKKTTKSQGSPTKKAENISGGPMIDPAQSAAAAAALVGNKVSIPAQNGGAKAESTGFRNLKDSLMKPHSQTIGGALDKMAPSGQKKSGVPFGGGKQVGHNQTFGADVARRNVPRRTNG